MPNHTYDCNCVCVCMGGGGGGGNKRDRQLNSRPAHILVVALVTWQLEGFVGEWRSVEMELLE